MAYAPSRDHGVIRRAAPWGALVALVALWPWQAGAAGARTIVLVNNQPFAIRMPVAIREITPGDRFRSTDDGRAVQNADDTLVFIGSVEPGSSRMIALQEARGRPSARRLSVDAERDGIRLTFDGEALGRMSWSLRVTDAAPRAIAAAPAESPDFTANFDPLPLTFARTAAGDVFDEWRARASRHGLQLSIALRVYHDGFIDLATRVTTETGAPTTGVYAAAVTRWEQPRSVAHQIAYDNRIRPFAARDRTPFRQGEGRHQFVQRGVDWVTINHDGGAGAAWLNDFAESFTVFQNTSNNRFRQPRYTGANIPQLGSEAQTSAGALYWITEIARSNIASYRDRLVENVLPPPGEGVRFASRIVFESASISEVRATEQFLAYTGYSRQERDGDATRMTFGVASVRFGTSYFPYSTLGENFDRLKLPGMNSEGYWPLAADTVLRWPLFADAIRRDLRIAKAMGFHVIRLHYLDVIASLPASVQREYLDFLFTELRHLRLGALLSPSEVRWTPAQLAAMVARYRDSVEGLELENEILIWGIPQDRPRYWKQVYEAVKAVAPEVPVHLTAHSNMGILTRLAELGVPFDRVGAHGYIDSLDAIPSGRGLALAVGNYAAKIGKPAIITEWNWRGLTRMTYEARARVYPDIIGGALETRAIGEFHQFQFQETLTVNPRIGRSGIRHYEPLRLSRRPKPEAFVLMDIMRRFVAEDDPIRRLAASHSAILLDRRGRATALVSVTNNGTRTERLRARTETSADFRAALIGSAEATLEPGETARFQVRLAARGRTPGFYHWFLRLQTDEGAIRYVWNEARLAGRPAFDAKKRSTVSYPGGAASTIALDFTGPISVVYGEGAPVLEMEAAQVLAGTLESASGAEVEIYQLGDLPQSRAAGTLIVVGTASSHALIADAIGSRPAIRGRSVQRIAAPQRPEASWIVVTGDDSRGVEEAALDYVLRYWMRAKDSAARRIGLVEKTLPRTVDPAKLPDRTP